MSGEDKWENEESVGGEKKPGNVYRYIFVVYVTINNNRYFNLTMVTKILKGTYLITVKTKVNIIILFICNGESNKNSNLANLLSRQDSRLF